MSDEGGFKTVLFGLVLFVVFTWLILTITIDFGAEYGRDADNIGNGSLNIAKFQEEAEDIEGSAQGYRGRFSNSGDLEDVDDVSGIFSIVTDISNMIVAPFTLLSQIMENIFGVPSKFTNVVLGILAIFLILATWRLLRAGS